MHAHALAAVLLLSLAALAPACGQWADGGAGRPLIQTFGPADYGAITANWSVVRDRRGRLYVGNDRVLEFDGHAWTQIDINGSYAVRGLAVGEDDRIWVGAINEIGYLADDDSGHRIYHSLNTALPENVRLGEVWGAHRVGDQTLFVTADLLLIWDGTRFDLHPMPAQRRLNSFPFRGGIAISQPGVGLWLWDGRKISPLELEGVATQPAQWAVSLRDGTELICVGRRLARIKDGRPEWLDRDPSSHPAALTATRALELPDGNVCVATYYGGLVVLRPDGAVVQLLGRAEGLPNLNCVSLFLDRDDALWVAAVGNVFRLDARNSATLFDARNGFDGGHARQIIPYHDRVVVLADEAAFSQSSVGSETQFGRLDGLARRFWDGLPRRDHGIVLTEMRGVVAYGAGATRTLLQGPEDFFAIASVPERPDELIVAEGRSIVRVRTAENSEWQREPPLAQLPEQAYALTVDDARVLWITTSRTGVFSIDLNAPAPALKAWSRGQALPADFDDPSLFELDGVAYTFDATRIFRLPTAEENRPRQLVPGLGLLAAERSATGALWAVAVRGTDEPRLVRLSNAGRDLRVESMAFAQFRAIGRPLSIARDAQDNVVWVGGTAGVLRLHADGLRTESGPVAPAILHVTWRTGDVADALPLFGTIRLHYREDSVLSFDVRDATSLLENSGRLEARLLGAETSWSAADAERSYPGLHEGRYEFQVRTIDLAGTPGPAATYAFRLLPPWYRSLAAWISYGLAALLAIVIGIRIWTRRVARLNAQLEKLVNVRTEELTRAMSARSAFLATMGHEIRNPLNGVVGLVENLRAGPLPPSDRKTVDRLGSCAAQLVSVVEDVLEYARVEAGRVPLRLRPFLPREPVESAIDVFRAADPDCQITLDAPDAALDARVIGDPDRIRQILVNYLANALKFGGRKPVTLRVRTTESRWTFGVIDRGPGIPKQEQSRLFYRFSRGSAARRDAVPGTGLGLAACKAYADAMEGEVWVESEPGHGAAFFLRLDLRAATAAETTSTYVMPDIMAGRRALVVDDHELNRVVMTDLLGRMGASTASAANIEEARSAFTSQAPDVVFVDFDLDGATGADLAKWIRRDAPAGRDVPIIATSAFEVDEVRRRCADAGMDGFLGKPVTAGKVAETMARIENIRSGGDVSQLAVATTGKETGFLDLMADGDATKRKDLERTAWRDLMTEALESFRGLRRGDLPHAAKRAHRMISAATLLELRDVAAAGRELNHAAQVGKREAAAAAGQKLRRTLAAARRQARG